MAAIGYGGYGWYGDYYYPGTGYYVYDSYRRPYAMTTTQRQYWTSRSPALRTSIDRPATTIKPNWSAFNQRQTARRRRVRRAQRSPDARARSRPQ